MVNLSIKRQTGFTIVELLIVIVVIGILAAITIVAYNGVQNRAYDATVQANLRDLSTKVSAAMTTSDTGTPPTADQAGLASIIKVSKSAYQARTGTSLLYCRTDTSFGFVAQSKSGQAYVVQDGSVHTIGNWGGSSDDNACANNTTIGFVYSGQPGYAYIPLYNNSTWQSWIPD